MYDLCYNACKRNGFIKYGLVRSAEQSLCWQIEYKVFLYYFLCMICGTLHVKEMVSLNMASFLVRNNSLSSQIEYQFFLYHFLWRISGRLHVKEMVSLKLVSLLVGNNLCAGKLSIRSFFIIYYV